MNPKKFQRSNDRNTKKKQFLKGLKKNSQSSTDQQNQTDSSTSEFLSILPYDYQEVIQEILFLGTRYLVDKETTYLAIAYFQIYQNIDIRWYSNIEKAENQETSKKLALALFSLSSKFNDIYNVSIQQLTRCYGGAFRTSIIVLEQKILSILDYQIPQQTPYSIFYSFCGEDKKKLIAHCKLFEKAIIHEQFTNIDLQIIVKSIVHFYSPQKWQKQNLATKMQIKTLTSSLNQLK